MHGQWIDDRLYRRLKIEALHINFIGNFFENRTRYLIAVIHIVRRSVYNNDARIFRRICWEIANEGGLIAHCLIVFIAVF